MGNPADPWMVFSVAIVASLFSSVGHGGASGYLALLSLTHLAGRPASTLALLMNLFVATISFIAYRRAKFFELRLAAPFLFGSVPGAYFGGKIPLAGHLHQLLIGIALGFACVWMLIRWNHPEGERQPVSTGLCVAIGGALGLASGVIGIGGGVFLSPILVHFRWANVKESASVAAIFIVANSIAGLLARSPAEVSQAMNCYGLLLAAVIGSICGSMVGAYRASNPQLKAVLGSILGVAAIKLILEGF